jgi:hypothetical protein
MVSQIQRYSLLIDEVKEMTDDIRDHVRNLGGNAAIEEAVKSCLMADNVSKN